MLWTILLIAISTVSGQLYSILTPPNDIIVKLDGTAEFKCEVEIANIPELTWEFNHDTIYSLQYGVEDYPKGKSKYSVEKNGKEFVLKISNVRHSDGGRYTCRVLKQAAEALLIVKEDPKHHSIVTPPHDVTGRLQGIAKFNCGVEFEHIPMLSWEFNDRVIYSLQFFHENYPMGNVKYSVVQDGRTFTLTVSNLQFNDGGRYSCRTLDETEQANLIVMGIPEILTTAPHPVEGSTAQHTCTAQFTGPKKQEISSRHYPLLRMFLDGKILNGESEEQALEDSTSYFKLVQIQNITLEAKMHGSVLWCEIRTSESDPALQVNATTRVEVLYSVRHISYSPYKTQYEVDSVITCSANGNPQPDFQWEDRNTGRMVHGMSLEITEEMAGHNSWKCTAKNTVSGSSNKESIIASFEAVLPVQSNNTVLSTASQNDHWWIIVLAVAIPSFLAIVCLTTWLCYRRHNKLKNPGKCYNIEAEQQF